MIRVVSEVGAQDTTVAQVVGAAGVSRRTFYEQFADRDDCLLTAIEDTAALAGRRASAAVAAHDDWVDRVRAGLWALLEFFDEQPNLADLCLLHTLQASPRTLARCQQIRDRLARVLDEGRAVSHRQSSPLTAEATIGGALAVIRARLLERARRPLTELFASLMSFIVLPYLGAGAAIDELSRPMPARSAPRKRRKSSTSTEEPLTRLTYRTMRVLAAIAVEPGLKNSEVSERAGVTDEGQTSRLLGRLARIGLVENRGGGIQRNAPKAWQLTPAGARLERSIRRALP
jgi:AcrR family transcriptional regulator